MKRYFIFFAAIALGGCTHVSTLTTLHADGSFHEKITFKAVDMQGMMGGGAKTSEDPIAKFFKFDKTGAKITRSKDEQQGDVLTMERDFTGGREPKADFQIIGDKGSPIESNQEKGVSLPNGDVQYDVEVKYLGTPDPDMIQIDPNFRQIIKAALPDKYQSSSATIDRISHGLEVGLLRTLFGPPYPELMGLMTNEDAVGLRLGSTLKTVVDAEVAKDMPDLTAQEKNQAMMSLSKSLNLNQYLNKQKASKTGMATGGEKPNSDMGQMTNVLYEVAFNGSVVETNGLFDPLTGHVYWCYYAASAAIEPFRLHLVVHPKS